MTARDAGSRPRVLVVGGGFAGLAAARRLDRRRFDVTLIDERNFHLFQPLLYQVATGSLAASDIATPLRMILSRRGVRVLQERAVDLDPEAATLSLAQGRVLHYDYLIIATGVTHGYFGHDEWAADAPGMKALEDAFDVRARIYSALEQAERCDDEASRRRWLNFVVVGAGPTGVEVAGALGELTHRSLAGEFDSFDPHDACVYLVEGADRVLPTYSPELSRYAEKALGRLGVTVRTETMVTDVDADGVTVKRNEESYRIEARTKIWAAGVRINDFGHRVLERTGVELGPGHRARVQADFSVAGFPNVFIVGDLAFYDHEPTPLPGVATAAIQAGEYVATRMNGNAYGKPSEAFRQALPFQGLRSARRHRPLFGRRQRRPPQDHRHRRLVAVASSAHPRAHRLRRQAQGSRDVGVAIPVQQVRRATHHPGARRWPRGRDHRSGGEAGAAGPPRLITRPVVAGRCGASPARFPPPVPWRSIRWPERPSSSRRAPGGRR